MYIVHVLDRVVYVSYKHLQTVLLQPLTLMHHIPSDLTTEF